jgi:hypothetical protein
MATIRDILGADSLKFENEFKAQGLNGKELENAMINLARNTRAQRENQNKQTQIIQTQTQDDRVKNSYGDDSFWHGVGRGAAEANSRLIAFGNYLGVVPDDVAKKNAQILDDLEKRKELDSNNSIQFKLDELENKKDKNTLDLVEMRNLKQRLTDKEALKQESANAQGFVENAKSGIKSLVDVATHPSEWTTQGVVAGILPNDPANLVGFVTGGLGGKIVTKVGGSILSKVGVGVADGVATNAGSEYAIAKGTFKSDEEAKKAAVQAGVAGATIPVAYAAGGAAISNGVNFPRENPKIKIIDAQKEEAYSKILNNPFLKSEETKAPLTPDEVLKKLEDGFKGEQVDEIKKESIVQSEIKRDSIETVKTIAQAEQDSISIHEGIKLKLQEAVNNGASIDEMIAIRNNSEVSSSEATITKIINNNEDTTARLSGFRIVSVIEDTIKNANLTPDEVKQKLIAENVSPELATVASKSYILKKTDMLVDYIQNKVDEHLTLNHDNLKKEIDSKVDLYNKQKIADEELWTNSLTKKTLDDYISKEIGDDNISIEQRGLIQELNKIGLVEDLASTKLNKNINGQYDMGNNNVTLNNTIPNIQKAQVLTHEYVHSALGRLVENKRFNEELTFLMGDAQKQFKANKKDINQYGFTSVQDFAAEALSNPYFARDLNEVKLSAAAKEKLGVKEYINTMWEAIVTKFSDVVYGTTGKRMKLDPDSYYGALNNMINKELTDIQNIKEQRLNDGTALAADLKQPVEVKATTFDNLKLHPRYDELLTMREDVKATDIKYENKVLNKGTVVHDANKFGGVDKTQVVPTSYERNYNADFKLTKQDIDNIKAGKIDENITQKLKDDLSTLDNHPDWKKYSDDIDVNQSKDILGQEFNDNHYINKNGELVENGKVLFSIDKNTKEVDFKSLDSFAEPLKKSDSIIKFMSDFKKPIKTFLGDFKIDIDYMLNKAIERDGGKRIQMIGYIKPTLERPAYIIEKDGKNHFIKPFIDENDKLKKFLSVVADKDGNINMVTSTILKNKDIKRIVKDGKIVKDFTNRLEAGSTELAPVPARADRSPTASNSIDKSISKNKENINNEKFPAGKKEEPKILFSKNFTGENKTISERMDSITDKAIDTLDNFFKGLTPDGKLKPKTNIGMDAFRKAFVPDAHKEKQFVEVLRNTNKEKARQKIIAKNLQEDLNTIPKEENSLLVMALDGDIPKENIKATLGDELFNIYTDLRRKIDDNANDLVNLGMLDIADKKEDYVKRFYKEHLEKKGILTGLFGSGHKLEKNFKRKDLTKEQRDSINQIRDAGYVVARTLLEQNNQIRKAKFLNTLADQFSVDEPRNGFIEVPLKKDGSISVFGNLTGKFVPEHIMDELNGIYKLESTVDNTLQKNIKNFSRWLKGTWTAGNPSTHLYNVGSNMLNLYLNGQIFTTKNGRTVGGGKGIDGIKKFFNKDTREAYKQELTEAGLYDDSFFSTLESVVDDLDVKTKQNFGLKDIINGALFRKDSKITKAVENVYDLEDKVFRVFVYEEQKWDAKVEKYKKEFGKIDNWSEARAKIEAIELTADEKNIAMNEARDMFVDYSKPVPNWIQTADNYMVLPFARYTYLATIRQTKTAIKHPFRALAISFGFGEALKAVFGEGEDLDDNDPLKPDWMKTSFKNLNMYGAQNFIKLSDSKDKALYFNQGRLLPGFRMYEMTLGFYHDLWNTVVENKDKFGQKLFNDHETDYEKTVKTLSKVSEAIMPPIIPFAVPVIWNEPRLTKGGNIKKDKDGNPMTETISLGGRYGQKVMGAISGSKLDRYGNPTETSDVIKQMFGLKLQRISKKDEANKQLKALGDKYKPEIQREKTLKNPKAQKEKEEEYTKKVQEIKKAAPGFDLGQKSKKSSGSFDVKFDF